MTEPLAPNTGNYFIGKGVVVMKRAGETEWKAMGNVPEFEFTPTTDNLDHFSSMEGVKSKDFTIVIEKGGELRIVMEEATADNIALIVLGTIDRSGANPVIEIFGTNAVSVELKFFATNEVGPKWDAHFPGVDFLPSGSWQPISDELGQMEVTGQIKTVGGSFGTITFRPNDAAVPFMAANPVITGTPEVGEVLTVSHPQPGTFISTTPITGYTYQWKADGVNISLATASTYTLTSGEIGKDITCAVTATNATGSSTAAISNELGPVAA